MLALRERKEEKKKKVILAPESEELFWMFAVEQRVINRHYNQRRQSHIMADGVGREEDKRGMGNSVRCETKKMKKKMKKKEKKRWFESDQKCD